MNIKRTIDKTKPVWVYRNLQNRLWSIMQNGLVVAHAKRVCLRDARYHVREGGRQRVLREKCKNVHAFVIGTLSKIPKNVDFTTCGVSYNPYNGSHFTTENGEALETSDWATLDVDSPNKVLAIFKNEA